MKQIKLFPLMNYISYKTEIQIHKTQITLENLLCYDPAACKSERVKV